MAVAARRASSRPVHRSIIHSEEELRLMLGQKRPGATRLGRDIILNALDLGRRIVRNVMRPRQEIAALDTEATLQECLEIAERTRYSRFPILRRRRSR